MNDTAHKFSEDLQQLAVLLDAVLAESAGERTCFCLVVATAAPDNGSYVQYVTNVERDDVRYILAALVERWHTPESPIPDHLKH